MSEPSERTNGAAQEDVRDLGFGARIAQQSQLRLLNRDGSFNVTRGGISWRRSLSLYHLLLTTTWTRFYVLIFAIYVAINLIFAAAYLACGPNALHGTSGGSLAHQALDAFFFSVQTVATIGYGRITPDGVAANALVALEALVGLMGFALATSMAFARFARPLAHVMFSERAVIAPHHGATAFMFRLANERSNQLLELQAKVILSRVFPVNGKGVRRFEPLTLERPQVMFLPLHWTIVHAIDDTSPMRGLSVEELQHSEAEVLVLLTGVDETFSQTVYARTSYKAEEIVFGARFADMFHASDEHLLTVDLRRLSEVVLPEVSGS